MKIISPKIHGLIDYLYAVILGSLPWILSFSENAAARNVFVICAAGIVLMSLLTRYEFGLLKLIPYKIHLVLDILFAVFLIAAPLIFNFDIKVYIPLVVMGEIALLAVALSTDKLSRFSAMETKRRFEA